jgi:hypothetical protein
LTNCQEYDIIISERKEEVKEMKRFRIEHKHSGTISVVAGHDFYDAMRRCGKSTKFWKLVEEF